MLANTKIRLSALTLKITTLRNFGLQPNELNYIKLQIFRPLIKYEYVEEVSKIRYSFIEHKTSFLAIIQTLADPTGFSREIES